MDKLIIFFLSIVLSVTIQAENIPEDIIRIEHKLADGKRIWVYAPKKLSSPKLPCILISPAGSALFHGMNLSENDTPEHFPYVRAGFAVIAYDLSGPWPEIETDATVEKALFAFMKSNGGIKDASTAIKIALKKHFFLDKTRIYAVGHHSGATLALTIAQRSKSIKGCVAYSPFVNLATAIDQEVIRVVSRNTNVGLNYYINTYSPHRNTSTFNCPLFLFCSKNDEIVSYKAITDYAALLKRKRKYVKFVTPNTEGHYKSMIREGIPSAIKWLKQLDKRITSKQK